MKSTLFDTKKPLLITDTILRDAHQSQAATRMISPSDFATNVDNTPMTQYYAGSDAIIGIGLGYRASYRFDVGFGEVSPYVHADFQWNALRGDHRDAYTLTGYTKPNYLNVPIYAGFNTYQKQAFRGMHEPIIPVEKWNHIQQLLHRKHGSPLILREDKLNG